jgi:RNA-directed DNA polymerase
MGADPPVQRSATLEADPDVAGSAGGSERREGRPPRTTRNKNEGRGTPHGSPLAPLLANRDRRRFVVGWKAVGHGKRLEAHIIHSADDLASWCRATAAEAMAVMRSRMVMLRRTVNETETRLRRLPEESVHFLGETIGRCHAPRTGRGSIGTKPAATTITGLKAEISAVTRRRGLGTTVADRVAKLNRRLLEGSNSFCLGPVSLADRAVDRHARHRLRQWL